MAILKSERHHWWPEVLSHYWADSEGCAHWIDPTGRVKRMPPKNLGVIGNGHHIKFGNDGESTVWDESFEQTFSVADSNFPRIIDWLTSLRREILFDIPLDRRFLPEEASDKDICDLIECVVSLAIRSPKNREAAVAWAEQLRGPLPSKERNRLIGANMRNDMANAVKSLGGRGKFVAIFSPEREFIFGDGFFHTIRSPANSVSDAKIFVPLTPSLAVLYVRPMSYRTLPRILTLVVTPDETDALNDAVQVYARDKIFFRSQQPSLLEHFTQGKHLRYSDYRNPVDQLIDSIPGIDRPSRFLETWFNNISESTVP